MSDHERNTMKSIRFTASLALAATLALSAVNLSFAADGDMGKTADRVTNDPTAASGDELLLAENVRLTRSEDGIGIEMKLITPEAGSYTYPETIPGERQAQPEAFTGWVFVFNNPELCKTNPGTEFPCGGEDFNDEVKAGAYNFSGTLNQLHQVSGGELQLNPFSDGYVVLNGEIGVGQEQRPPVAQQVSTHPLENPMGAAVHVAIAPHGQLDATTLPDELYIPVGNPACECWWVATFKASA
jgi:hypothetical protein